jgi:hypothetical protein
MARRFKIREDEVDSSAFSTAKRNQSGEDSMSLSKEVLWKSGGVLLAIIGAIKKAVSK